MDDEIQGVLFHIHSLYAICSFKDLNHILKCDVHFQILLAKRLLMLKAK